MICMEKGPILSFLLKYKKTLIMFRNSVFKSIANFFFSRELSKINK